MFLFALLLIFIVVAVALAWFLLAHDRGSKEPIGMLWVAMGLGMAGAVMASLIEERLITHVDLLPGLTHGSLLWAVLAIGIIEEVCKFLPLALLIYKKSYFNEHTDGIIYFGLAGLGFGLPENILYTIEFGTDAGMARLFLTPLFHVATTGIVGYYLAKRKLAGKPLFGIALPLLMVAGWHGLYNFGLLSANKFYAATSILITLGLTATFFTLFIRATEKDQKQGLSLVGHNSFCRACGWANPQHHLYCIHCGKHA